MRDVYSGKLWCLALRGSTPEDGRLRCCVLDDKGYPTLCTWADLVLSGVLGIAPDCASPQLVEWRLETAFACVAADMLKLPWEKGAYLVCRDAKRSYHLRGIIMRPAVCLDLATGPDDLYAALEETVGRVVWLSGTVDRDALVPQLVAVNAERLLRPHGWRRGPLNYGVPAVDLASLGRAKPETVRQGEGFDRLPFPNNA